MSNDSYSYDPSAEHPPEADTLRVENEALRKGFTLIPNVILRARGLSRDAKLLYGVLLSYAWQKGSCWPGYDSLQADLQCGRPQLAKYIRELKAVGLIEVQRRGQGKTSIYTIKDVMPTSSSGELPDSSAPTRRGSHPQKFQNETSRSSISERLGVSKRNGEEDPQKKTQEKKTQPSNSFESKTQELEHGNFLFRDRSQIENLNEGDESIQNQPVHVIVSPDSGLAPVGEIIKTRRKRTSQSPSGRSITAATTSTESIASSPKTGPLGRTKTGGRRSLADQATPDITAVMKQVSDELHDEHERSSLGRAVRLWQQSKQTESAFISAIYAARKIAKGRGDIEKRATGEAGAYGFRNRVPYFLAVLEDQLGLKQDAPNSS